MSKMSKVCVGLLAIIAVTVIFSVLSGCGKEKAQPAAKAETEVTATKETQKAEESKAAELKEQEKKAAAEAAQKAAALQAKETALKEAERKSAAEAAKTAAEQKTTPAQPKITLKTSSETIQQVLRENNFWEITASEWTDAQVTDFNLVDINGQKHKLSNYRGKNVIVFEWTPSSPGCLSQIPFLVDLRARVSEDQLAILAVALKYDKDPKANLEDLKKVVQKEKINFPVFLENQNSLGLPFYVNVFVPCSFFIKPDGTLKAAIEEIISVRDMVRVLQAK
jgi:peroxiredoxin